VESCTLRDKRDKRSEGKFYVDEEEIAVVKEYKYFGCVVDEHGHHRRMVEERAKATARALSDWVWKCRTSIREKRGVTFKSLVEVLVDLVIFY